jgi:uroporphyrin-III C-methyltransferase
MTGFVSVLGAGPGDPELLTLKAVDRLGKADAILFDDLSAGPILTHAREGADLVGVGKRAGRRSPKQDHVSRLLVDYAKTGARVVRLKSGDGGVFGRLGRRQPRLTLLAFPLKSSPVCPRPVPPRPRPVFR